MRLAVAALLVLAACHNSPYPAAMGRIVDAPRGDSEADRAVLAARRLSERGLAAEALTLVEGALRDAPRHVDGLRLRQDILRVRGRTALLRSEVEQMLAVDPEDPVAHYLLGRILPDEVPDKEASFRRAARLAPDSLWPWLGLAYVLRSRDPEAASRVYHELARATDGFSTVAVAHAALLRQMGRYEDALQVYQQLRSDPDSPGVGDLGVAQTLLRMDRRRDSWAPMLAALRARPFDPGLRQLVRDWLATGVPAEQLEQILDVLAEDPARLQAFGEGAGTAVLVTLLLRLGQPHAALDLMARAGVTARDPALRRLQRQTMLATGDVAGMLASIRQDLPEAFLIDEANHVRGRWFGLLAGDWMQGDPLHTPDQSERLVQALRDCGQLAEAAEVAAIAALRWPEARSGLDGLRNEVQREISFEGALRRLLYGRYASQETPSFDDVLQEIRQLSHIILGEDVVGEVGRFHAPLVGEMLDPFATGLCEHLRRYNKYLILGRRSGGVTEGMLLTLLSVRELPEDADLPLPARCFEVIGEHREIRSLSGVIGGDLAGVALLNHYLVDFDAVREWAGGIAARRRVAAEDGLALLSDPLPAKAAELDSLDAPWRLAAVSSCEDAALDLGVLEMIRHHERAHLVDSFHFLPFENNLFRVIGLLFRFSFSADAIEAEMERRAELAAVALSRHPELALAHVADFLEPAPASPHSRGFRRLARDLAAELPRHGAPPADVLPSRWHLLEGGVVRSAARALLTKTR